MARIEDNRDPIADDAEVEATVLRQLLLLHPTQITVEELTRDIAPEPQDFAAHDAIERAVRDLGRAGLLHRNAGFAIPTRAALRFDELLGG